MTDRRVKIFLDGALTSDVGKYKDRVQGFTTNPTLMRAVGITDYEGFARGMLEYAHPLPVSLEVFADEPDEMYRQARTIASWGDNAYVKVPVTNTHGYFTGGLVSRLTSEGVKVNVTAVFTSDQVIRIGKALGPQGAPAVVSMFAGRVADTGREPGYLVSLCKTRLGLHCRRAEVLWASPRQLYDVVRAEQVGCDIITLPASIIKKMDLIGKSLEDYSLETVRQFYNDAVASGYALRYYVPGAGVGPPLRGKGDQE